MGLSSLALFLHVVCCNYGLATCSSYGLRAWGSSKTNPNTEEIEQFQKQLEKLNMEEPTKLLKAELLRVSKALDELPMKQEKFWSQRSRIS